MVVQLQQQGLSLVEVLTTVAVIAVLSTLATPAWSEWLQRRRVAGVSAELLTDIQYLRSEAARRNTDLRLSIAQTAGGSCYVLHSGGSDSCSCSAGGLPSCTAPAEAIKTVLHPAGDGVTLQSNSASMLFSARRGTVTPTGTLEVRAGDIRLRHVVNLMGRTRVCLQTGTLPGHPPC